MSDDNDPLVHHLLELCVELDKDDVSIVLGGGMSLYLRIKFASVRTPRLTDAHKPRGPSVASS